MKTTTSLLELIQSEMINRGFNEFGHKEKDGPYQLVFFEKRFSYIGKVSYFDDDIYNMVNDYFFRDFKFNDQIDREFKKMLFNRYLDRQIAKQTVDIFINNLIAMCMQYRRNIDNIMLNMDKYYQGQTNANGDTHDKNGYNKGYAELPQDKASLDLQQEIMPYANTNEINRAYADHTQETSNTSFNPDVIDKLRDQLEWQLLQFDKLFLQVW